MESRNSYIYGIIECFGPINLVIGIKISVLRASLVYIQRILYLTVILAAILNAIFVAILDLGRWKAVTVTLMVQLNSLTS